MNYYACDDTGQPLNYTPYALTPLARLQTAFISQRYQFVPQRRKSAHKPYQDYRPTSDYNNEEYLNESDMAEVIVIDIKPFRNAPEIQGLIGAEIITDPYEGLHESCHYEGCDENEASFDVYEY